MAKKVLTLCIIYKNDAVLLGMKKRGFGMGKWNGFGGKVEEGEGIEVAAKRELLEEAGITANTLEKLGVLEFSWVNNKVVSQESFGTESKVLEVNVFRATDFSGEPKETEEMKPQWFTVNEIPYDKMWSSDAFWYPPFLAGKKFTGKFIFDSNDNVVEYELKEIK